MEVASNDGYLLRHVVERGIPALGIEPAANVAEVARSSGSTRSCASSAASARRDLVAEGRRADLIAANNVMAHVPDLNDFVAGFEILLADDGVVTVEVPHLLRLVEDNQFDTIYHEHFQYFSLPDRAEGVRRATASSSSTSRSSRRHGGSLRLYAPARRHRHPAGRAAGARPRRARARARLRHARGPPGLRRAVEETKWSLLEFLIAKRREGKRIAGYGAPGKGNTLLNYCGIRTDLLDYTVDRNPYKQGQFLPGTHIPILHPEVLEQDRPDYILILPWNLKQEIVAQLEYAREWGAQFVVPDPEGGGPVKVVLFCGGQGLRMREASEVAPKPMIPVGNRPILWHVMKYYAHFGHTDFVLCLGYKAEVIKQFFLTYNEAMANDFVLSEGGAKVHLLKTDIHNWNITFVDTGLHSSIGERLRAVRAPAARRRDVPGQLRRHAHRRAPADDDRAREVRRASSASFLAVKPNYSFHVVQRRRRRARARASATSRSPTCGSTAATSSCARRSSTTCARARTSSRSRSSG